ncbi:MAG: LysM peptidoglycan-binding domain-containing protein [Deltaproteobacteria bacterium]|nr:LysM peptidoglycan-binding domain-containing protein [Deltaproteobacteria bacterium]
MKGSFMEWGKKLDKTSNKVITETDFTGAEQKKFKLLTKQDLPFVLIGIIIVVLIAGFVSLIPMIREHGSDQSVVIDKKIAELNEKIEKFKEIEGKLAKFEKNLIILKKMDSKIDTIDANLTLKIGKISQNLSDINDLYASIKSKIDKQKKIIVKKKIPVRIIRKKKDIPVKFYQVKKGDTFYSISRRFKISLVQLKKLNNFNEKSKLYPNMKIKIRE